MKVSVVISVYKDIQALNLIVEALKLQTYKNFEVVIAEDAQTSEMQEYIQNLTDIEFQHVHQEDLGVRRTRSQNNALLASTGEYIVFIDGDCIPSPHFVASHAYLAETDTILSGRRFNLDITMSTKLREVKVNLKDFLTNFLSYNFMKIFDKESRFEQGIYLSPKGFLYALFLKNRDRYISLLGCHWSCYKKDIVRMNGFDEGFDAIMFSDDNDMDWRLRAAGLRFKSCKNAAILFHLYHETRENTYTLEECNIRSAKNKKDNKFVCEVGLNTH